jgi:hypothetical protein
MNANEKTSGELARIVRFATAHGYSATIESDGSGVALMADGDDCAIIVDTMAKCRTWAGY